MSKRVLVVFASTHGHTAKIAERIGAVLGDHAISASVRDVHGLGENTDLRKFDGVIIGASVHAGHHQREMLDWIGHHRTRLSAMPSAFFSVSLTAADDTDEARAAVREQIDDVLDDTGWMPRETVAFAGALQFKEYNLPTRVLMRLMARHIEHQTGTAVDVHEDTDYTDWAAVDRFAEAFVASLQDGAPHAAATA
ncbi:MAG TPA: flavodoxin domain-containing protein [Baekduia sp.]|nr:flavodoxin domain-containing protein [Baekduia sp.]